MKQLMAAVIYSPEAGETIVVKFGELNSGDTYVTIERAPTKQLSLEWARNAAEAEGYKVIVDDAR